MAIKILYVEDSRLNMRLMRKFLSTTGYMMLEAFDGITGIEVAVREKPNLILMDIHLSGIDGVEVTRRLKALPDLCHVPVIAVTADAMHGSRERLIGLGCDGYIAKPIARSELLEAIAHFLTPRSMEV